ncbi:NACHT domain family protein [Calothrix sp. NIES-4071]|nr:NACHT domain family protein [Calothrix sp. NIES-4071]BAZ59676.1 NACHT domain family protein [Calothrix sp. NIES-4105]
MSQSSIAACPRGIDLAKNALIRKGLSQQELSKHVSLSRGTVDNFFNGIKVRYYSFATICKFLELDIDEITGQASNQVSEESAPIKESLSETIKTDALVQTARNKIGAYMKLSGQQRKNLLIALVDAFPTKSSLEHMLSFELNKNLNEIVSGGSLQEIVFSLIKTAESQGWVQDLVRAARASNPGNSNLQNITEELLTQTLTGTINIDELVRTARDKIGAYIEERCSTMRVLDMTQPIGLDDIYTSVNILETITGRRRLSVSELIKDTSTEDFERFRLGEVCSERVPGLKAVAKYSKLIILGKPGAGKTTFLKHLAYSCIKGKFQENRIPLFITLKDFAEAPNQPSLFTYLNQIFVNSITINTDARINSIEQLLKQGKLLVLLDGLDEAREVDSARVLNQIQGFTNDFPKNQFVITCRIASREFTFQQFTEVEVADFNDEQIESFSQKWFTAKNDTVKATKFIEKLQDSEPYRELASLPLLLTLLCLVFEESAEFPKNRSELYKEGLDILLKKWDGKRNIERDQVYKRLSLKRKEDLLSQVAYSTFERGQYFFKQKEVELRIIEYICHLPDCSDDPEALQLDSEAVLKSIEAQHGLFVERARGIYSFSHLTFHEYFTARKIVTNTYNDRLLRDLATRITEKRWSEVFLLTVGMLDNADPLLQLMKQEIDKLLRSDDKLQQFLAWVQDKSKTITASYKPAAVRAWYFSLDLYLDRDLYLYLNLNLDLSFSLDRSLYQDLAFAFGRNQDLALDRNLALVLTFAFALVRNITLNRNRDQDFGFALALYQNLHLDRDSELNHKLQQLKTKLPHQVENVDTFRQWWEENGSNWIEQLRDIMTENRNIDCDWQFTNSQRELLKKYYGANKLLVDCLNSDCYVSRDVRKYIEDTLILPIKSIPPARPE